MLNTRFDLDLNESSYIIVYPPFWITLNEANWTSIITNK